jgi:glycine oxidase ThiO
VIVVGAGIVGCAIARELAVRGVGCTVVDPRPVGGGATQASAGMLAPYVEAHEGGPMLDLCVRSLDRYDRWIAALREEGHAIDYARSGTLEIALSAGRASQLRGGHGEWLDAAQVARDVPQLGSTDGALRNRQHGYVNARELAAALAQSAERHGATFLEARAARIQRDGDTLAVDVGPDHPKLQAKTVVLAAGAWMNRIAGVHTPPLRPVRGQLVHLAAPRLGRIDTILWGPDCYIVPLRSGAELLVGATVEEAGFDEHATPEGVSGLYSAARRLLPALPADPADASLQTRVGLRPATPDELPVLGVDPEEPGLVFASGHYRNGILLAPITGTLVADVITQGTMDPALDTFSPTRFYSKAPRHEDTKNQNL